VDDADAAGFTAALAGVHTLYLVSAAETEDRPAQHLTAVRAAADAGVQRIAGVRRRPAGHRPPRAVGRRAPAPPPRGLGSPRPMSAHRVVCAALVRDGRVLLGHRSPGRRWYPDVWDLPGGHVDHGESPAAALAREVHEELGVRIEPPAAPPDAVLSDADLDLSAWVIRTWDGEVTNAAADEHDELRWVDAADLAGLRLAHPRYRDLLASWLPCP
jgi:8-oxo-dGTP pyrophosphatase MutT (NUDIX family)